MFVFVIHILSTALWTIYINVFNHHTGLLSICTCYKLLFPLLFLLLFLQGRFIRLTNMPIFTRLTSCFFRSCLAIWILFRKLSIIRMQPDLLRIQKLAPLLIIFMWRWIFIDIIIVYRMIIWFILNIFHLVSRMELILTFGIFINIYKFYTIYVSSWWF